MRAWKAFIATGAVVIILLIVYALSFRVVGYDGFNLGWLLTGFLAVWKMLDLVSFLFDMFMKP